MEDSKCSVFFSSWQDGGYKKIIKKENLSYSKKSASHNKKGSVESIQ